MVGRESRARAMRGVGRGRAIRRRCASGQGKGTGQNKHASAHLAANAQERRGQTHLSAMRELKLHNVSINVGEHRHRGRPVRKLKAYESSNPWPGLRRASRVPNGSYRQSLSTAFRPNLPNSNSRLTATSPSGKARHPYVVAPERCRTTKQLKHTDFVTPVSGGAVEDATTFRLRPVFVW
jgi:hypothetical protein